MILESGRALKVGGRELGLGMIFFFGSCACEDCLYARQNFSLFPSPFPFPFNLVLCHNVIEKPSLSTYILALDKDFQS